MSINTMVNDVTRQPEHLLAMSTTYLDGVPVCMVTMETVDEDIRPDTYCITGAFYKGMGCRQRAFAHHAVAEAVRYLRERHPGCTVTAIIMPAQKMSKKDVKAAWESMGFRELTENIMQC